MTALPRNLVSREMRERPHHPHGSGARAPATLQHPETGSPLSLGLQQTRLRGALSLQRCLAAQVGRAKKCLDFAATLYLLHLAAVSVLSAFPRSFAW